MNSNGLLRGHRFSSKLPRNSGVTRSNWPVSPPWRGNHLLEVTRMLRFSKWFRGDWDQHHVPKCFIYHLVMTNIAMENPRTKWRFIAGKIIYFYGPFSMAMLNNQRVRNIHVDVEAETIVDSSLPPDHLNDWEHGMTRQRCWANISLYISTCGYPGGKSHKVMENPL